MADIAKAVFSEQEAPGTATTSAGARAGQRCGVVTDVAGVKAGIVSSVGHPRFVGGHPMAGSEQEGVDGADPDLFLGATWVLTPGQLTSGEAYSEVQALVRLLGANPVAIDPRRHDELVALVSHTPHLTAAALMNLAADEATSDATLLRLAAGGFRDMTRSPQAIPASGRTLWPKTRTPSLPLSTGSRRSLDKLRTVVADGGPGQAARATPAGQGRPGQPAHGRTGARQATELRLPVPDRPGVIAEVSTLLGGLGVNIFDVEIAHSAEGDRGVMVLIVDARPKTLPVKHSPSVATGRRPEGWSHEMLRWAGQVTILRRSH